MLLSDLFRVGDTVRSRFNRQVRRVRCSPLAVSGTGFSREERLPGGRLFRLRRVTWKSRKSHHPQVTKGVCSWLGSSCVGIPSLRRRSVGPRRTDIPVLTALSPHPCGSAHCASSAFGQRPSRDWCRLNVMCMKIKSRSTASRLKPVPQGYAVPSVGHGEADPTGGRGAFSGTGFSREEASSGAYIFADSTPSLVERACSRMLYPKHPISDECTGPFVSKLTPTSQ